MCALLCAGPGGSGLCYPEELTSLFVVRVCVCALLTCVCVRFCVQVLAAVASVIQRNRQLEASLSQASQSNQHLQVRQCIVCGGGGRGLWVGGGG